MKVALIAKDKPDAIHIRMATRDAHVAYLKSNACVEQAGPLMDDIGQMIGSLIILDVEDVAAAQVFADNDPYKHADLFASVELIPWNRVIG
ncbi:YciI family protein [Algirhabdus cladophorae]|uniref:YciI family protein n=1 Tax=Algirhabdus cladophorae TaxID=3377108 RepID=UPI003B8451A8